MNRTIRISFAIFILLLNLNVAVYGKQFNCWHCRNQYDRNMTANCSSCGWDICFSCGACEPRCSVKLRKLQKFSAKKICLISVSLVLFTLIFLVLKYKSFRK